MVGENGLITDIRVLSDPVARTARGQKMAADSEQAGWWLVSRVSRLAGTGQTT